MDGFIPPVVVELVADAREFMAKKNEVVHGIHEIGKAGELTSARLGHFAQRLSTGFLFGIAGAMGVGLKYAIEYEHAIEKIGLIAGVSKEELKFLREEVINVSNETATSATDLAGAYLLVEQAGYRGAKATEIVANAAKAAKITNTDLTTAVKGLLVTQNLHIKGTENVAATTGYLVESLSHGTKSFSDTASLLTGKVALAFKTYGIDIASAITAQNIFSKAQLGGTKASMGLAGVIEKLEKPSDSMGKVLKSIGLTQGKIAQDLQKPNGLILVFSELRAGFDKFASAADKQRGFGAFFSQIFGGRTAAAAQALLQFAPLFAKGLGDSADAAKLLEERFKEWQTQTTEGKLATFKTALQNFEIGLGENLLPAANKVLTWINKFAERLRTDKNFRESIKRAFEVGIGAAIGIKLLPVVKKISDAFRGTAMAVALPANTTATQENTAALLALRTALIEAGVIGGAEAGVGGAAAGAAGAAGGGLLAAAATPAVGIAAMAVLGYEVYKHRNLMPKELPKTSTSLGIAGRGAGYANRQYEGIIRAYTDFIRGGGTQAQWDAAHSSFLKGKGHTEEQWLHLQAKNFRVEKSTHKVTVTVK